MIKFEIVEYTHENYMEALHDEVNCAEVGATVGDVIDRAKHRMALARPKEGFFSGENTLNEKKG